MPLRNLEGFPIKSAIKIIRELQATEWQFSDDSFGKMATFRKVVEAALRAGKVSGIDTEPETLAKNASLEFEGRVQTKDGPIIWKGILDAKNRLQLSRFATQEREEPQTENLRCLYEPPLKQDPPSGGASKPGLFYWRENFPGSKAVAEVIIPYSPHLEKLVAENIAFPK